MNAFKDHLFVTHFLSLFFCLCLIPYNSIAGRNIVSYIRIHATARWIKIKIIDTFLCWIFNRIGINKWHLIVNTQRILRSWLWILSIMIMGQKIYYIGSLSRLTLWNRSNVQHLKIFIRLYWLNAVFNWCWHFENLRSFFSIILHECIE